MNNPIFLENYKNDLEMLFKIHYKKLITKDINVSFIEIVTSVFLEIDMKLPPIENLEFLKLWYEQVHNLSFLKSITSINQLNEIIIHNNEFVQVHTKNKKENFKIIDLKNEDYQLSLEMLAQKNNIAWNYSNPFVSFTAKINEISFRISLIHFSTSATKLSKVFLRTIQNDTPNLKMFSLKDETISVFLNEMIQSKKNILISGGTGSGKTTFLRALLNEVPEYEHVIILEDTYEIFVNKLNHTSMLAVAETEKKSLKDYCSYALRMTPDRLLVGEMRSTEVVPFLLAMNTGHKGLMSTVHANSAVDALSRISLLFSLYAETKEINFNLITKLVCKNIDYVIHMEEKNIKEIIRVIGSEGETPYFEVIYN